MTPDASKQEFEALIRANGVQPETIVLSQGIKFMLNFYAEMRTGGPADKLESDMLLFQWGTIGTAERWNFDIKIARQFTRLNWLSSPDTTQLSCVFRYESTLKTTGFDRGYRWCDGPHRVHDFEKFISENIASKALYLTKPLSVQLSYFKV